MKHPLLRFQFSIRHLLFLLTFVGMLPPGIGSVSGYLFSPKEPGGVPFLSKIPYHTNARRSARLQAEPRYELSGLMLMVTPKIVIEEEDEDPAFQISVSKPMPQTIPKTRSKNWLAAGWTIFAVVLVVVSVARIRCRDYN